MVKYLSIILGSFLLVSCAIEERTTFNEDFSGTTMISIDVTPMLEVISAMDPGKVAEFYEDMSQDRLDSMMEVTNQGEELVAQGLKMRMGFDSVSNTISIGFDFQSLEQANILAKSAAESNANKPVDLVEYAWEEEGKILIMPGPSSDQEEGGMGLDQMIYTMNRSFPIAIASVSDDRISISEDGRSITFKGSMQELQSNPMEKITVTFR